MLNLFKSSAPLRNSAQKLKSICCKTYSTQPVTVEQEKLDAKQQALIKKVDRLSNVTNKARIKKPQKPPFMKNIFFGVYDTDVLTYPELEKEDYEILNKKVQPLEGYYEDLSKSNTKCSLDLQGEFTENLKRLGGFGLGGPQLLDGQDLNCTETSRFNDVMSSKTSSFTGLLYNEQLGMQALLKVGSDDQKRKYLPQLIAGSAFSAFCMSEKNLYDISKMQTCAELEPGKKFWILNGEKTLIVNAGIADLFVVIAGTGKLNRYNAAETYLTAFLVERDFGGISTSPCEITGIGDTNVETVKFQNTPIPVENVLGEVYRGEQVIRKVMNNFRLSTGSACSALVKNLLNKVITFTTHTSVSNKPIAETDHAQSIIAEMSSSLYAMESIAYLTSGLIDQYENQDCELEAIIVKVFNSQEAVKWTTKAMQLIGNDSYFKNHWCNVLHGDAISHLILDESSETMKLKIALLGLQHAGNHIHEDVRKRRNPLYDPFYTFKKSWEYRHQVNDDPKLKLRLGDYLHPSCAPAAELLEYCVLRLQFAVDTLFGQNGLEVINHHMDLLRVAECAIDIYAMTASLGRASRAYCIGLQNADVEMILAKSFCVRAKSRIQYKINQIIEGPYNNCNDINKTIAKRCLKVGQYCIEHPLTRNY